jgi:DNA-binding XRE family transcriptional regulator
MDAAERALFKSERERQKLNQAQVASAGGITQGTISKIEIEPDYDPSISVFRGALRGINMTLSSFFARIEGLPAQASTAHNSHPPELSEQGGGDDERAMAILAQLPPHAGASRATMAVIDYLVGALVRARRSAEVYRSSPSDSGDTPRRPPRRPGHSRQSDRRPRSGRRRKE